MTFTRAWINTIEHMPRAQVRGAPRVFEPCRLVDPRRAGGGVRTGGGRTTRAGREGGVGLGDRMRTLT